MKKALEDSRKSFYRIYVKDDKNHPIDKALELAYPDMSRHAKGHNEKIKESCLELLKKRFDVYFENQCQWYDQETFDNWHKETCDNFINEFDNAAEESGSTIRGTYGRAQKVINMTFKYLYCMDLYGEEYFQFCHMPLDSFVLDWIWEEKNVLENGNTLIHDRFNSWNKLEYGPNGIVVDDKEDKKYYSYMFFQKLIRNYCKGNLTPLELDFLVWRQFQWEKAANEFFKQTNIMFGEQKEIKETKAADKYEKIKDILNNNSIVFYDWEYKR